MKVFMITETRKEYSNGCMAEVESTIYIPYIKGAMKALKRNLRMSSDMEVEVMGYDYACANYPTAFGLWEDFEESDGTHIPVIGYEDKYYNYTEDSEGLVSMDSTPWRCWIKL